MKKLSYLLVLLVLVLVSCEKETVFQPIDPPVVDTVSPMISHFITLTTFGGEREPKKLRDTVRVYLHSTMSEGDKEVVYNLVDKIISIIGEGKINFIYTDDINNFDIGMVYGSAGLMNTLFGTNSNPPDYWYGGTSGNNTECTTINKRYIWYDWSNPMLIKHEFLHAVGLGHATSGSSIMYHMIGGNDDEMSNNDIAALKLLYYDGVYGEMVPKVNNGTTSCTEDDIFLLGDELEELKEFSQMIIENNYQ